MKNNKVNWVKKFELQVQINSFEEEGPDGSLKIFSFEHIPEYYSEKCSNDISEKQHDKLKAIVSRCFQEVLNELNK